MIHLVAILLTTGKNGINTLDHIILFKFVMAN